MFTARPRPPSSLGRSRFIALPLVLLIAIAMIAPAAAETNPGWLSVAVTPDVDAPIAVDGVVRNTGAVNRLELLPGEYRVSFGHVEHFMAPQSETVVVTSNATTSLDVEYVDAGMLAVDVSPDGIEPLITVNGVGRDSGSTKVPAAAGSATICGEAMTGYLSPPCEDAIVRAGATTQVTLAYEVAASAVVPPVRDGRVSDGLVALYDFADGSGATVSDTAGVLDGMDLTIAKRSATSWGEGTLTLNSPTIATTTSAPTDLYKRIRTTGEFTVEAWIEPANLTQNGPARILSLGKNTSYANFVLGQGAHQGASDLIQARHQRAGDYKLSTARGTLGTGLTHVVATRTANGTMTVYVDGKPEATRTMAGNPSNWDLTHKLGLGAELDGTRPWLGTYHLLAIYDTALNPDQITTNHTAGSTTDPSTPEPTPAPQPEPAPQPDNVEPTAPAPGASRGTTTQLSQHGITWEFSGEHEYGTYANGDYWVVGPVEVAEITPRSVSGARNMHGSMINPSPRQGSLVGYDSDIRDVSYDASRNAALNVSPSNPLRVSVHSSLVSTISVPVTNARPGIQTAAVLTVVPSAPADGSFRPPYSGTDKTSRFTVDQMDRDLLPRLAHVEEVPDPSRLADEFQRVWLDHVPGWTGRSIHPASNMPDYGRVMSSLLGRGYLTLTLDFPQAEKERLLINLVQVGIDFHGVVEDGGEKNWVPNGGHATGRKLPILFAGTVLGDQAMASIGDRNEVFFGEDAQTFHVDANTLRVGSGYNTAHLGMPEWGIRHRTDPSRDNASWTGAAYRRDSTANGWHSHVLVARVLGLKESWNHDALFDYTDRYMETEEAGQWFRSWDRPFSEAMWDTYRSRY